MSSQDKIASPTNFISRRGALGFTVAAGSSLLACNLTPGSANAEALTREQRDKLTPEEIIALMKRGNQRFSSGESSTRNYLAEQRAAAAGQFPAAVVLSCIDSRAPAEVVMDLGIGDVFNARVAGNVANQDILGSMEFACKVAGAKVVLVMGHTACGAVKGAIDNVELGNLTGLLAKIRPAADATKFEGERKATNPSFVDAVTRTSVEMTMNYIREHSEVLRELEKAKSVTLAGAIYDLKTAKVEFLA